jgi:hypothetical protein
VNTDIARPNLASCGTRLVGAILMGRVLRLFGCFLIQSMQSVVCFFKPPFPFHQLELIRKLKDDHIAENK